MPTGDGLLARVHPPLGILSATQLRAVAEAARRYGNGHVDITARGNLQIRGVSEGTACALAAHLTEAGLGDVRADGGPQRLTLTSPLARHDPDALIDAVALASAIETVGLTIPGLPAKTLVAIESGGRWGFGEAEADLLIRPTAPDRIAIGLASETAHHWCPEIDVADAPDAIGRVLTAFATAGCRRMRDLKSGALSKIAAELTEPLRASPSLLCGGGWPLRQQGSGEGCAVSGDVAPLSRRGERVGARLAETMPAILDVGFVHLQSVTAIVVEAPFGRCTADSLDAVASLLPSEASSGDLQPNDRHSGAAQRNPESTTGRNAQRGISGGFRVLAVSEPRNDGQPDIQDGIRLTTARGLILAVPQAVADATRDALAAAGFITDPADPRRAVAACPGAPACASGSTPVPNDAARLAEAFAPFAARGLTAHVSGCAKGCAHPRPADLTLVAEDGRYRVLLGGGPADAGQAPRLTFEAALDRVRRADPARSLAGAFPS